MWWFHGGRRSSLYRVAFFAAHICWIKHLGNVAFFLRDFFPDLTWEFWLRAVESTCLHLRYLVGVLAVFLGSGSDRCYRHSSQVLLGH